MLIITDDCSYVFRLRWSSKTKSVKMTNIKNAAWLLVDGQAIIVTYIYRVGKKVMSVFTNRRCYNFLESLWSIL